MNLTTLIMETPVFRTADLILIPHGSELLASFNVSSGDPFSKQTGEQYYIDYLGSLAETLPAELELFELIGLRLCVRVEKTNFEQMVTIPPTPEPLLALSSLVTDLLNHWGKNHSSFKRPETVVSKFFKQ